MVSRLSRWRIGVCDVLRIVAPQRPTKLHCSESKFVAQAVGRLGELVELLPAIGVQKFELACAVGKLRKGRAEQPDV